MNTFYEQELPDITSSDPTVKSARAGLQAVPTSSTLTKQVGPEKRGRYMKKDPQVKAKEKLWESIITETEEEDSPDTSDDNEHQI